VIGAETWFPDSGLRLGSGSPATDIYNGGENPDMSKMI